VLPRSRWGALGQHRRRGRGASGGRVSRRLRPGRRGCRVRPPHRARGGLCCVLLRAGKVVAMRAMSWAASAARRAGGGVRGSPARIRLARWAWTYCRIVISCPTTSAVVVVQSRLPVRRSRGGNRSRRPHGRGSVSQDEVMPTNSPTSAGRESVARLPCVRSVTTRTACAVGRPARPWSAACGPGARVVRVWWVSVQAARRRLSASTWTPVVKTRSPAPVASSAWARLVYGAVASALSRSGPTKYSSRPISWPGGSS
jgi:hypothetical protein